MCGIVGYVGTKNATPILLDGLTALEYRGYDSAGLYVAGAGIIKRVGQVSELRAAVPDTFAGTVGIAHTRWATHGAPTEANAHPHADNAKTVFVVHNGIIENYAELRKEFTDKGVQFISETDTEVLANLIGKYHAELPLETATAKALEEVRGTYGIAVASVREPGKVVIARLGSPLLIGIADDGTYIASDASAVLPHTRRVMYLEDGEMGIITKDGYRITTLLHAPIQKEIETLEWNIEDAKKQGFEHFMLKEIMEIPEVIENTMRGRVNAETGEIVLGGLADVIERLSRARRIVITGCGSAYYAGQVGELLFEEIAGIPTEVEIASELRYRNWTIDPNDTALIAVTQSGETADTLGAVRKAKETGTLTIGVVNVVGSTIARETDAGVYNHAGSEIGVASTKAFISQMVVLTMIALLVKQKRGGDIREMVQALIALPNQARSILKESAHIQEVAKRYATMRDALFIGRKFQFPIAYEGALKLKEISYLHAEAYGAGEMKHGPLALIDADFPTIALIPQDSVYEKTRSNIQEIRGRGGRVVVVTTTDAPSGDDIADDIIIVPGTTEALLPILTTIPLHLFAYHVANTRGLPIDRPRNLAKSLTVE